MKLTLEIPTAFHCSASLRPYLQKVFDGEYEIPLPRRYGYSIADIGANCGAFAIWAYHRWPGSFIECYEPHPETFKVLETNLEPYENIKLNKFAIGNPGFRPLYNGRHNEGEASLYPNIVSDGTGCHVEVVSPVGVAGITTAEILKLDVEGAELEILEPLIKANYRYKAIVLEYHNEYLRREIDALLKEYRLVGSEVIMPSGRGIVKYMHESFFI